MNESEKQLFDFSLPGTVSGHHTKIERVNVEEELCPENDLEKQLLKAPAFVRGLHWGVPRYGHPEGEIYKHVREVLDNVDKLNVTPEARRKLRLVSFSHDTFKYLEDKSMPRDWTRHHGILARRFMEKYIDDQVLLDIIEYHDEAYFSWRCIHLFHQTTEGTRRLNNLMSRLGDDLQLYYLFFKCDTLTGDKNLAPIAWFETIVKDIDIVEF